MGTIDLGPPPPTPQDLLDGLPRRVTLTLPELQLVARHAGDAPLPFAVPELEAGRSGGALDDRLGGTPRVADHTAYVEALATLHDPGSSLSRRGLLIGGPSDGVVDKGLIGAVGLLATPRVAIDLDVSAGSAQVRSWHRQAGGAVAALSTQDGVVFELAWFPTWAWRAELARVAVIPEDLPLRESGVADGVDLPHELADAALEASRRHRADLVPVLVAQHSGSITDSSSGRVLTDIEAAAVLGALATESRGRLRALVARIEDTGSTTLGVVAWTLLHDGWRALRPRDAGDRLRLQIGRVIPDDLGTELAPVLAEVMGGPPR